MIISKAELLEELNEIKLLLETACLNHHSMDIDIALEKTTELIDRLTPTLYDLLKAGIIEHASQHVAKQETNNNPPK